MNGIGFKNFRRFSNFETIDFKTITFLVGRNNSGKSTLVKALLLIVDYFKADIVDRFSFNELNSDNANVATYSRAKSKHVKSDFIAFEYIYGNYKFNITIDGSEDSTTADVTEFSIEELTLGFKFHLMPMQSSIAISNSKKEVIQSNGDDNLLLAELLESQKALLAAIGNIPSKASPEYINLNNELSLLKRKISTVRADIKRDEVQGLFELGAYYTKKSLREIFDEAIKEFSAEYDIQYREIQSGKKAKKAFENYKSFKDQKFKIESVVDDILNLQSDIENIYLGASLNKQAALFSIRDRGNALAQTIHEYKQLGIDRLKNSDAAKFVDKWIQKGYFDLGESFDIKMHAGEAYEVIVSSQGFDIHLADKGMGSIQIMLLILRLATIIHKKGKSHKKYTVVIEEPELNLHPALQSKLALLFYDVNQAFGINFIVETHSEYLIRKTQLLVKNNNYELMENNPFCIIYFDNEVAPWHMNYRQDGKFIEEFGTGFFDETRNIVRHLI